tara:strand:+ start:99 stop:944 length:846 start_codon:yes stop_codon:yes gene_type:complete
MSEDKKQDFLEVDDQIGGQNYVCLSFLSPDSLIQDKSAFNCAKFLQSYCKDKNLKFDDVYNQYKDFTYKYEDQLQRDFDEKNNFQTSLRGIKVRGVFDTREAADARAKKLSTTDTSFHVFIGQVGYWLPWDPNADKVADEVFQNSQLNDMMDKYQQNNVNRDIFYEEQKREKVKTAREEAAKKQHEENKNAEERIYDLEPSPEPETDLEPKPEPETESSPEPEMDLEPEPETESSPETETNSETFVEQPDLKPEKIDEDLKSTLEEKDPWLRQKEESSQKE